MVHKLFHHKVNEISNFISKVFMILMIILYMKPWNIDLYISVEHWLKVTEYGLFITIIIESGIFNQQRNCFHLSLWSLYVRGRFSRLSFHQIRYTWLRMARLDGPRSILLLKNTRNHRKSFQFNFN